jgi:hypothetical protein
MAVQLCLAIATAENPKGATRRRTRDRLGVLRAGVPKAIGKAKKAAPATMVVAPDPPHGAMGMIRGRKPAGNGGHNPSSRGAVYDQRTYGSVGAGAGNRPGYPTDGRRREPGLAMERGLAVRVDELRHPVAVAVDVAAADGQRMNAAAAEPAEEHRHVGLVRRSGSRPQLRRKEVVDERLRLFIGSERAQPDARRADHARALQRTQPRNLLKPRRHVADARGVGGGRRRTPPPESVSRRVVASSRPPEPCEQMILSRASLGAPGGEINAGAKRSCPCARRWAGPCASSPSLRRHTSNRISV